jgi:dTDP-3-amino-3,4,6-trideoxy-alpha-D-glucose transaminase
VTATGDRLAFYPAARPFEAQREELLAACERVLGSGRLVLGPEVEALEHELARLTGCAHAVGVASGTDALELALRALELPAGAEVLCPNLTAVATATAIVRAGLTPLLVDVDERTLAIDAAAARRAPRAAAVVAVHLYGRPAPVAALLELGLPVVEDAAQAHGLEVDGRAAGSAGTIAAFSFYPTKNLGGFGDGGAVTTSDAALAGRVRRLRAYGEEPRHFALEPGLNSRLDELQAALLRVRLGRLEQDTARRTAIARAYDEALGRESPAGVHHLYVVRSPERDRLRAHLDAAGIETAIHYPWTLSAMPAFADCGRGGDLRVSETAATEVLSLPCHPHLSADEEQRVCAALRTAGELAR